MRSTPANRTVFAATACAALAAALVGGSAHASEVDSATAAATVHAAIHCADPSTPSPGSPGASAPCDPIGRASGSALEAHPTTTPAGESLPWGTLIFGVVALQVVLSVAWTIVRHSRDG